MICKTEIVIVVATCTWDELSDLSDFRFDMNFPTLGNVSDAQSTMVGLYQGYYQTKVVYKSDRPMVETGVEAWLSSILELWLVEGLG